MRPEWPKRGPEIPFREKLKCEIAPRMLDKSKGGNIMGKLNYIIIGYSEGTTQAPNGEDCSNEQVLDYAETYKGAREFAKLAIACEWDDVKIHTLGKAE